MTNFSGDCRCKAVSESGWKCTAAGWCYRDWTGRGYCIFPDGSRDLTYGYFQGTYCNPAGYRCDAF